MTKPNPKLEKTCKWHKCTNAFTPARVSQKFCSAACRLSRDKWKAVRGARAVDPILENDTATIEEIRATLQYEIDAG